MKTLKSIFLTLLCSSLLQSCSIQSNQLSSLIVMVKGSQIDLLENSWTLSYGDYKAQVFAVSVGGGISFLNEFGDSLIFDGWVVREVSGLSINRANWKVQDRQASRRYLSGSRLFAEHLCDSWQSNIRLKMTRYTQKCEGFSSYENSIIVDKEGHIILIRQAVGSNTYLKLTKNKSTI